MICKRINNDFDALVNVVHEGVKIDLSLYEITSVRMVSNQAYQVTVYEIRSGSLFLHVTPLIVPKLGKYKIVVTYRIADPTLADGFWNYEFDKYLVTIVGCSEEEDAGDVVITADAVIGMQGKSAYQVWLDAGNVGTLEDYLADIKGDPFTYDDFTPEQLEALKVKGDPFLYSDFTPEQIAELQQPATDAIVAVNEAEALRVTAENTRVQNEQGRVTAEGTRQGNETAREDAEDDRAEAEALRLSAETARGQNEQERVTAEGLRVTAEGLRQTNTATAITNANNAATNANTKAGLADTAANNANAKATLANDAAILANEKAGLADTAATNADNARLAIQDDLSQKANKVQEAWITPTLLNGWTTFSGEEVQYRKNQFGVVEFKGRLNPATKTNVNFMTLPTGYRPITNININFGGSAYIVFTSSGNCQNYFNVWQSLNNIQFNLD